MWDINENPNEETIKCVIVGDNNVGKTRLICSRAYNEEAPNYRCMTNTSHVPTVWAIDQYRNNSQVLDNARCMIDGIAVSLRLWDTFGDHHKNRRFAYGKADVVLICFSACDRNSLAHVEAFWLPEVRRHCKNIPVLLVACKCDLRFDRDLNKVNRSKTGLLARPIKRDDLIFPDKASAVGRRIDCPYYETSVFLGYGIRHVFENACRVALLYRKSLSVWTTSTRLKKTRRPQLQEPLEPPRPEPPDPTPRPPTTSASLLPYLVQLYEDETFADVVFVCQGGEELRAHQVVLAAASDHFLSLFDQPTSFSSDDDESVRVEAHCGGGESPRYAVDATASEMRALLRFCYTGELDADASPRLLRRFGLRPSSSSSAANRRRCARSDSFMRDRQLNLERLGASLRRFADVAFAVDDGRVRAHKVLLAAGCDVMRAMFAGNFVERVNDQVRLPGTTCASVDAVFDFICTGRKPAIAGEGMQHVVDLLSLANRLCLAALVSHIECEVIEEFKRKEEKQREERTENGEMMEDVIVTLHIALHHNAHHLSAWCLHFLAVHYNQACRAAPKLMKALPEPTQRYLELHRWPPVWYIKQRDVYDKATARLQCKTNTRTSSSTGVKKSRK